MMTTAAPRPTVLLVESDDGERETYATAFAAAGWDVVIAETGAIALAKAIEVRPGVIVTGLRLAGIDGYDLLRLLRIDRDTRELPTIALSGDATAPSVERAHAAGATVVLSKPCVPGLLVARARELVGTAVRSDAGATLADVRATATPPEKVAALVCPFCSSMLADSHVHATRVGQRTERWVYYRCPRGCGEFEYRQRTRRLRRLS